MSVTNLIINADDFGASSKINNATISLHKIGVISSTSIIAHGPAFDEGVMLLKEYSKLGVGVHLCLHGSFYVGLKFFSLLDMNTHHFYSISNLVGKLRKFSLDSSEIYTEYCLQIEKTLDHGIHVSHLDHHHNLHSYPQVLCCMIKAAKKYKIKAIRSLQTNVGNSILKKSYRNIHQLYLKSRIITTAGIIMIPNTDYEILHKSLSDLFRKRGEKHEIMSTSG
jgi:predicted glycoside hydrolase/deacetylase ChbG (UPF0249 family)